MYATKSISNQKNNEVNGRQIALFAAFILPAGKLLETPSLLSKYAKGDLLLPAFLQFLFQALILFLLLLAVRKSETPLLQRLQARFGKWTAVFYGLYAVYFIFSAILPLLQLEKYVYAVFFDTEPTLFFFVFFFFLSAFICTKGFKTVGRSADLCLFLFLLPFLALLVMSVGAADFSNLLPFFSVSAKNTSLAFIRSTPHFSDVILLLPLLGNYRYKKGDGGKIIGGYAVGAGLVILFLAVFFGIYASLAPREHYAFSKIAQYFPALSVVGRIDLIFIYFLTVVLFFYTCLPLQYTTELLSQTFQTEKKVIISLLLNVALLLFVLFFNQRYNLFQSLLTGKLFFVFWIFADLLPLLLLLLPKEKTNAKTRKTGVNYA